MAQAVLRRNDDKKLIRFYLCLSVFICVYLRSSVEKLFFFYVCFWLETDIPLKHNQAKHPMPA
jgi:hypothetical protein